MRIALALFATLATPGLAAAQAVPIPTLPVTGGGAYVLTGPASPAISMQSPHPWWVGAQGGADWIGPSEGTVDDPIGDYTYTTTIDLTGFIPGTAVITGELASDNSTTIYVNGQLFYWSNPGEFNWYETFTLPEFYLVDGVNTLEFVVNNGTTGGANPTGLIVTNFVGTAVPLGQPQLTLTSPIIAGQQLTATVDYATPQGTVVYAIGGSAGGIVIPAGPCAGTQLGIGNIIGTASRVADDLGTTVVVGTPQNPGPTLHVQAVDVGTCATTNIVVETIQ